MKKKRILSIFGTRSEAIKMAPVLLAMREAETVESIVCITAQHRQKLDQVLSLFAIKADFDLNLMKPEQTAHTLAAEIITSLQQVYKQTNPDYVLVQGSSLTSVNGALSAYYNRIPLGYIGSGYRSGDLNDPWPNEGSSRVISAIADHHFVPTESAKNNLLHEGIDASRISVVGSTAVDGIEMVYSMLQKGSQSHDFMQQRFPYLKPDRKIILVACSRVGADPVQLQLELAGAIAKSAPEVDVVLLSSAAKVLEQQRPELSSNIFFLPQQDYLQFVYLLHRSFLVITDSGCIQEEAPSLETPTLVMREKNDRMDGISQGRALLIGLNPLAVAENVRKLLDDRERYAMMAKGANPFGDGRTAERIVNWLK